MIKYLGDATTTFSEFPDEIALCVNISNCPGTCECCSEPELREDVGVELTIEEIDRLISTHPGITLFGFMGGDNDPETIYKLSKYIHTTYQIKTGMYSGKDYLIDYLAHELNCYKIGHFIIPKGPVEDWPKQNCGPLTFPFSNQLYFERDGTKLINATYKFRRKTINNWEKEIIR